MKELEYYRGQHIAVMNQLEATSQESSALRGKYGDLVNDKQRLDREVQAVQKEVSELRCQNQEVLVSDASNSDTMNQHYLSALRKYEAVKDEYDALRKRYDDLISSHSSAVNKLELSQEEAARLKKQYEEVAQERNSAVRERNALKQQCTAAIRQWDIALRERNEYREALAKVQQQHEEAVKEINQAMVLRMKASKDMKRLTEERNAALQEYSLIMGERDTVHKEMEKLGDDLTQAYTKITHLENQNKQLVEEKKTLSYQIETLRREISSALQDIDIVRGPKHSKDREEKKKRHRNSSPNTFEQEQDAIAELDSVIESYHKKANNGVLKRSKRRGTEKVEKNGGTWPKARGGPLIQNGTGTILHPRKTKERLPLSVLLNQPPKYESYNYNRISNPIAITNFSNVSNRHTVYKSVETPLPNFSKSGQLFSQKSFTPAVQFKDIPVDKKPANEFENTENRLSSTLAPSETSIDFSVKSGNVGRDLEYFSKKRAQKYTSSNESQVDTLQHNRAQSQLYSGAGSSTSSTSGPRQQLTEYNELEGSASSSSSEAGGGEGGSRSGSPTPCNSPEAPRKTTIEPLETSEPERDASSTLSTTRETSNTLTIMRETSNTLEPPRTLRERDIRNSASLEVRSTQEREREIRASASLDINIRKPELRSSATLDNMRNSATLDTLRNTSNILTRAQINQAATTLQRQNATVRSPTQEEQNRKSPTPGEPRYLFIETRKCSNLGISLVGGNGVGIFVHSVQPGCFAEEAGLRTGDRILEYNGVDLRQATAEQAALELARPADKVTVIAQYLPERYNEVKDKPGDSFYVKAMFDRVGEVGDSLQLRFNKDDILYVDNTMFNGTPGHWRAWLVDQTGRRQTCGIIPSKFKIEEELLLRRSLGDLETDTSRRSTTSARRSFFRRKKHQRSSSRDSKELSHLTGVNLGWYSDSGTLNEETLPASYQRVERLDYPALRPVLIIGPLSECVVTKLLQEFPGKFTRCLAEAMHCSQATLEQRLRDALYVDYRKKGSYFECTTVQAVKDICEKNTHCILDVSIASIERLHRHQIYPIVLLIKFKSTKQIKEVKDSRYPTDKVSAKAAKEMYEQALKFEAEYRHYISAVIPAGVNVAYICTQVKAAVDEEQSKALWVPRGPP